MFSAFRTLVYSVTAIMFIAVLFSCTSTKQISYFQDLPDKDVIDLPPFQPEDRIIENGDDLYIYFSAKDNEAASYYNKSSAVPSPTATITGTVPMATNAAGYSYIVANDGFIEIPNLGIVKVTGLTVAQLRAKLLTNVSAYLKDPSVEVRFNTFKISILGEVRSPGRFTLDMQRTTILDALAAAGDLPPTAKRYDVKLYRDYNGQRKIYKVDLTKANILNSQELFQMRHNDILYVTPLRNEIARQNFGTAATVFSFVLSIATLGFAILK
jgi:polysaccharide export outer membrane protein